MSMRLAVTTCFFVCSFVTLLVRANVRYEPNWESLDSRPLPQWYDEAKIGIFLHWGVFSVPGFVNAWFWYNWKNGEKETVDFMKANYPPDFTYADFAPKFRAEFFNPDQWVDLFESAGARYVVLTTKHCEGFTNWPSNVSWNWNAVDVGPKRDLVGDFSAAVRKRGNIRLGFYHALDEFFNPLYLADKATGFKTHRFPKEKSIPEFYELVNTYKPDLLWSDFWTFDSTDVYFNSTDFVAWLYNDSPVKDTIVTNDRWGSNTICKHGGYWTCEDRYDPGHLVNHKWECCWTLDSYAWVFRRNSHSTDYHTTHDIITKLARVVSCGGNLLMNVGPTADGMINPIFEDRLREFGSWLKVNGEAIYSSKPWIHQNDANSTFVWYTSKGTDTGTSVYAITLSWPPNGELLLGSVTTANQQTTVTMLGYPGEMSWDRAPTSSGIVVHVPPISVDQIPSKLAWVFRIDNLD